MSVFVGGRRVAVCVREGVGVSARRLLLYGGEAHGIDSLLDPTRTQGGHNVGAALADDERQALAGYLRSL